MTLDGIFNITVPWKHTEMLLLFIYLFIFWVNGEQASVLWACVLGFTACNKLYSPTTIITY